MGMFLRSIRSHFINNPTAYQYGGNGLHYSYLGPL
jgi:hypothetical protein